jgi:ADP-ribose pyrophosphatase YjhB (NUDIX family)
MIDASWYTRPEGVEESVAAGGVVARMSDSQILIAVAKETSYDTAVLPKGHVESGEEIEVAARREIGEEVGVEDLELLTKLDVKERLDFDKTEWKLTHYYLYRTHQVDVTPLETDVHTEMAWVPIDPVPELFWPEQVELIKENLAEIKSHLLPH